MSFCSFLGGEKELLLSPEISPTSTPASLGRGRSRGAERCFPAGPELPGS